MFHWEAFCNAPPRVKPIVSKGLRPVIASVRGFARLLVVGWASVSRVVLVRRRRRRGVHVEMCIFGFWFLLLGLCFRGIVS